MNWKTVEADAAQISTVLVGATLVEVSAGHDIIILTFTNGTVFTLEADPLNDHSPTLGWKLESSGNSTAA